MTGENFFPNATAYWNGSALATAFVDNTDLTASVPAGLLATPATAGVTVANPTGPVSVTRSIEVRPVLPQLAGTIQTIAGGASHCFPIPAADGSPALAATLQSAGTVAADEAGNIYIPDGNRVLRIGPDGAIHVFAGNANPGYSGDGGQAVGASLNNPWAVAADAQGNVYIADAGNGVIRKVVSAGTIATYAGNGVTGYSGDGGPATLASIANASALAVDAAGNLYFADTLDNRIRKIDAQGIISTCAGNGQEGYSGDGGPATGAALYWPQAVAADAAGNLFIADTGNNVIRKVSTSGIISTYAGGGTGENLGDGGPATSASWTRHTAWPWTARTTSTSSNRSRHAFARWR